MADFAPGAQITHDEHLVLSKMQKVSAVTLPSRRATHHMTHKPEVHNVLQRRQRRTEPRHGRHAQKFGDVQHVVFEICEWTDRQTDRHC